MKTRHARQIRLGIIEAMSTPYRLDTIVILNSRYYSSLAVQAFNQYRARHTVTRWETLNLAPHMKAVQAFASELADAQLGYQPARVEDITD